MLLKLLSLEVAERPPFLCQQVTVKGRFFKILEFRVTFRVRV
jgi:hypothetical protein